MNLTRLLCFSLCGITSGAFLAAQPVTVPTLGPRYKQTRERAEVLFGHRGGDYPLPDPSFAILQVPAVVPSAPTQPSATPWLSPQPLCGVPTGVLGDTHPATP